MLRLLLVTNPSNPASQGLGHAQPGTWRIKPTLSKDDLYLLLWAVDTPTPLQPEHTSRSFFVSVWCFLYLDAASPVFLRFLAKKCPLSPLVLLMYSLMDTEQI